MARAKKIYQRAPRRAYVHHSEEVVIAALSDSLKGVPTQEIQEKYNVSNGALHFWKRKTGLSYPRSFRNWERITDMVLGKSPVTGKRNEK